MPTLRTRQVDPVDAGEGVLQSDLRTGYTFEGYDFDASDYAAIPSLMIEGPGGERSSQAALTQWTGKIYSASVTPIVSGGFANGKTYAEANLNGLKYSCAIGETVTIPLVVKNLFVSAGYIAV